MRFGLVVTGAGLVALVGACNAILGNESEYVLVGAGGEDSGARAGATGTASGGKGGAAGSSLSSGGKSAGAAGKAGRGTTSGGNGGGAGAGEGGVDESAGAAGAAGGDAGAPSCVSRGAENCFNGVDDDCNGHIDCEDSACNGPAECRPVPAGAEPGYFAAPGDTCPSGYTRVDLHQDLQVPMQCNGCSCVSPTNLLCDSGVYGHGTYACPSYQFNGQLWDVFNDRCSSLPGDPNLHYYSIRGTSECTPAGTPTFNPATWSASAIFCLADRVGGGCGAGKACVPAEVATWCTLGDAGCSADYANDRGTWYEGFDDQRTCSACQCGLGTADCSASYIGVYSDGGCGTNPTPLQSVQVQGDACGLSFGPQSARIINNPVPGSGSCAPNNFINGDATPTNGHHACCAL
jgi:hypothetical protein